jgi:protein-disulfide isomerase
MRPISLMRCLAVLVTLASGAAAQGPASPALQPLGSFTMQQRQEIIGIMREALRTDPSLLRDAITALQEDEERQKTSAARGTIGELNQALFRNPADPVAGNPNGDVTVVEFYDARCPYCRRMVPVVAELLRRDPNVRFVYKDFPILGPASTLGARALLAAQKQGGYFKLHAILMTGGPTIDQDSLRAAAARHGRSGDPGAHRGEPGTGPQARPAGHASVRDRRTGAARRGGYRRPDQGDRGGAAEVRKGFFFWKEEQKTFLRRS